MDSPLTFARRRALAWEDVDRKVEYVQPSGWVVVGEAFGRITAVGGNNGLIPTRGTSFSFSRLRLSMTLELFIMIPVPGFGIEHNYLPF